MGVLLILLGLLLAGAVVDVLLENDVMNAAAQPLTVAGSSVSVSTPMVAAIAFVLGAVAVLLIVAGVRSFRRHHRRTMRDRIEHLEHENARLHTQRNLPNVIKVPDSDVVAWSSDGTVPPAPGAPEVAEVEEPSPSAQ